MKNKTLRTLISIPLTIIVGGLAIIEIMLEVIYQLVKLVKRAFKLGSNWFLEKIKPIYKGRWKAVIKQENDKDEVEIVTFDYELGEES